MYPLLKPGRDVPIKTMPQGYEYKTGDIIINTQKEKEY